jgi:hypothetical protein
MLTTVDFGRFHVAHLIERPADADGEEKSGSDESASD